MAAILVTVLLALIVFGVSGWTLRSRAMAKRVDVLRGRRPPHDPEDPVVLAAASADALLAGTPLVEAVLHMNGHVFEALDRWVVGTSNPFSLVDYVKDHHATIFAPDNGFLDGLKGYAAESIVADHFAALGHHVVLATATNEPGWDLLIDGHPFQVKAGETAAQAAHHALALHPGIPVITDPSAAEHLFAIDPHAAVLAVHEIGATHLEVTTSQTLDGLDAIGHAGSFHFPFITVAMSSWRELKLLEEGHATFESACAHVITDGIGVGAGMAAGAQTGVMLGGLVGPHGMALGGLLGGFVGAIAGKIGATFLKEAKFNRLYERYKAESARAHAAFVVERRQMQQQMIAALQAWATDLKRERRTYKRAIEPRRRFLNGARRAAVARLTLQVRWVALWNRTYRRALLTAIKNSPDYCIASELAPIVEEMAKGGVGAANGIKRRLEDLIAVFETCRRLLETERFDYGRLIAHYEVESRKEAACLLERLEAVWTRLFAQVRKMEPELKLEARRVGKQIAKPARREQLALPPGRA
jgi:hypothetical protein